MEKLVFILAISLLTCEGAVQVNPWIFSQRHAMVQLLVNRTTSLVPRWATNPPKNLLWGVLLQLEWQHNTSRLNKEYSNDTINGDFWWACINYYLSVVPYIAAMEVGIVPKYQVLPPTNISKLNKFCVTFKDCDSNLMGKWKDLFIKIKHSQSMEDYEDPLSGLLWNAHRTSIHTALPQFKYELSLLDESERNFGSGWADFVEYIATSRYQSDFINTHLSQRMLPPRVLTKNDHAPYINDMTLDTNILIMILKFVAENDRSWLSKSFLSDWENKMKSPICREKARNVFMYSFQDPLYVLPLVYCLA